MSERASFIMPVIDPIRDRRGQCLAARGAVSRCGDYFLVMPPSLKPEPPVFKIWRDQNGRVRCSCKDYEEASADSFRCEHILAVKHYLLAKPAAAYRLPDASLMESAAGADTETITLYAEKQKTLRLLLVHVAAIAARLLGESPSPATTMRTGMPEALLVALENCGDPEAARLAAEAFLERLRAEHAA